MMRPTIAARASCPEWDHGQLGTVQERPLLVVTVRLTKQILASRALGWAVLSKCLHLTALPRSRGVSTAS